MADFITKEQYNDLEDTSIYLGKPEYHKLLEKYTGIEARPYTAYLYFDSDGNFIGDSDETDLDDLLRAAYVEVRDG